MCMWLVDSIYIEYVAIEYIHIEWNGLENQYTYIGHKQLL